MIMTDADNPWWNQDIQKLKTEGNRLSKKLKKIQNQIYIKGSTEKLTQNYNEMKQMLRKSRNGKVREIRKAKRRYISSKKKQIGTITHFDIEKRFGSIFTKDKTVISFDQSDIYVLDQFEQEILKYIKPGATVRFHIVNDKRYPMQNKLKAINISLNVIFLLPDNISQKKDIQWCIEHGWFEVSQGYWSGPWYHQQKVYSNVPKNYICFHCKKKGDHWIMHCPFKVETQMT
eukprot:381196_1